MARHPISALARRRAAWLGLLAVAAVPALSGCSTGDVFALEPAADVGMTTAAVAPAPMAAAASPSLQAAVAPAPPASPPTFQSQRALIAYPRFGEPPPPAYGMPQEEVDCRRELRKLKVAFTDVDPIHQGVCGIDHPVKVSAIGSVKMKPAATLTCAMAEAFSRWTRDELVPSARRRYFSGVDTIRQGSSYSCRNIAGSMGVVSEHGKGNALDVMSITLNSGREIDVRKPGLFSFRQRGFLNTVRADGCSYFNTVLGPGYNRDHADHFHFDIKERRNGHVACR